MTDFQGTHYSATRLWNVENDEITYYPLDSLMTIYKITGEAAYEPETTENIVNMQKFNTRDKYAAFWTATTVIQRSRAEAQAVFWWSRTATRTVLCPT